jgi:cob(I)alamin adenosyltransferase
MKIYTKTGDGGQTSLIGGSRVFKSHHRIEAYGTVDELNAYIGLLNDQPVNEERKSLLLTIQERLFVVGSRLAAEPGKALQNLPELHETDIEQLEQAMDTLDAQLPELRSFILPGGHQAVSFCHVARTVCRRAERLVIGLAQEEPVDEIVIKYLNRLSDFLFVLARSMSKELGAEEILWHPK